MAGRDGYRWFRATAEPTAAERRVLDELAAGRTNAEIAVRLGLSPETVKSHIARMLSEAGCADRQALARWWQSRPARRPVLVPFFGLAARVAAVLAALALGLFLLVAGVPGAARVASSLAPKRALVTVFLPPDPTPTPAPTPKPGIQLPVTFLWSADGAPEPLNGIRVLAVDATGNVYVQDARNHRVVKFDPSGQVLTRWGSEGAGPGQFNFFTDGGGDNSRLGEVGAIAIARDGTVYVADYSGRVQFFDPNGAYAGAWGSSGSGPGQFDWPAGMVIDAQDRIYISDAGAHRVQVFDRNGALLTAWGQRGTGPGEFEQAGALAVGPDGSIYVCDVWNHRVQRFDPTGQYLGQFGSKGTGPGQFDVPAGVAVDTAGRVYVADYRGNRVELFDTSGRYLGEWGDHGSDDGEFDFAGELALDHQGNIYVGDWGNRRIQKFRLP